MLRSSEDKPKSSSSAAKRATSTPSSGSLYGSRPKTAGSPRSKIISSALKQTKRSASEDLVYANFISSKPVSRKPSAPSIRLSSSLSSAPSIPSSFDFVSLASALPLSPKHPSQKLSSSQKLLQRPTTAPPVSLSSSTVVPERVDLANRGFTVFPCLSNERLIKSLNLQGNSLAYIPELASYQSLTFLDLHNNKLDCIPVLRLPSLRVLMLSKNFIRKINNIAHLSSLDILDLNENHVATFGSDFPHFLRVLNLEKNRLDEIILSEQLHNLLELNLNRNNIHRIDFNFPRLKRLLLSHNRIQSFSDIQCIRQMKLLDLLLLGNPVMYSAQECWQIIQSQASLTTFNYEKLSESFKKSSQVFINRFVKSSKQPLVAAKQIASLRDVLHGLWQTWLDHGCTKLQSMPQECNADALYEYQENEPYQSFQDGSLYIVRSETLLVFGSGAFMASLKIPPGTIKHIHLAFLDIQSTAPHLSRLSRFNALLSASFSYNNINSLQDIILLAKLPRTIQDLVIHPSGNFVTTFNTFFQYAVYRLYPIPHKTLNGHVLDLVDRQKAAKKFDVLEKLFCQAPRHNLEALPYDKLPVRSESLAVWHQIGDLKLERTNEAKNLDLVESVSTNVVQNAMTYAEKASQRARWFDTVWPEAIHAILKEAIEHTLFP